MILVPIVTSELNSAASTLYFAVDDRDSSKCPEIVSLPAEEVTFPDSTIFRVTTSSSDTDTSLTITPGLGADFSISCSESTGGSPYICDEKIDVPVSLDGLGRKLVYSGVAKLSGNKGQGSSKLDEFELTLQAPEM